MECRLGKKEDINEITMLISDAIKDMESKGIHQWDDLYPTEDDFLNDINCGNLYVAVEDKKIIAIYVISDESDEEYNYAAWENPSETAYILHRFCVSPKCQGKGIGKQLLLKIEAQIKDMGYTSVRLDVFTKNPFAQRLYRHNGYEERGHADWRKGRFDLMEKSL